MKIKHPHNNAELNNALQKVIISEQRFEAAVKAVEGILWTNNANGEMEGEQLGWAELTGQTFEEYQGYGWAKAVHPDDAQPTVNAWNEAVQDRKTFIFEHRVKIKDGSWRNFSIRAIPLLDTNGNLHEWVGVHIDITEQKMAAQKIKDNETKLILIIEGSELGTWELNLKTNELNYSKKYLEIFGYKEYVPISHADLIKHLHPDDLGIRLKAFEDAKQTGSLQYEARLIWSDNSIHWMEGKGKMFFDKDNQPSRVMGIIRDITAEKNHRVELEESEQKFRLLANSMAQQVWTADTQGNLNYFNQSVFDFSGLTLEQIIKDGWLQIVHPEDREENIQQWIKAISTGKDFLFEHRFRRYDGEYRWQLSRAIPQKDEHGNIQMWVGTSTDIQNQKIFANELERQVQERTKELAQNNIELEKTNKELEAFAYISSHDLQEPLRKIQTFATRLLDKEYNNLSENGKDYFRRMHNAAERMQTLINDLLAYSRTNTFERKYEKINLNKMIEEVKEDMQEELLQKNATLEAAQLCEINIIPFQFRQLLHNLISNSLKFSNPNRAPHLKIKNKIGKGIEFKNNKLLDSTTYYHISISDNGIGFEQHFSEKIFELFQRLHGKNEYNGTGIGLAIVKKIVENHNGIITAKGQLNKGATFDIYLPMT